MVTGVASLIVISWSLATGASLTGVTTSVTVAGTESVMPSLMIKVNISVPLKLAVGVYNRLGARPPTVPLMGCVATV